MIKTSRVNLFACVLACIAMRALVADTEIVDGIEWTYAVSGGKASLGNYPDSSWALSPAVAGRKIPNPQVYEVVHVP